MPERRRLSRDEVRAQMLDTAREMALESGIGLSLDAIVLEDVIQQARVPRSSVFRLWPNKEAFTEDLLCHLAQPEGWFGGDGVFDPETIAVMRSTTEAHRDRFGTPEGRRAVFCEALRLGLARNLDALVENRQWRVNIALRALLESLPEGRARDTVAAGLAQSDTDMNRTIVGLAREMAVVFGLRPRAGMPGYDHLITAGRALLQGMALARLQAEVAKGDDPLAGVVRDPVPGPGLDGPAEWTLGSLAYLALVDAFLELDPGFVATG